MKGILTTSMIHAGDPRLTVIETLYVAAFPKAERVPFAWLLRDGLNNYQNALWAFMRGQEFCGFMTTITAADVTLVGYFAMVPALRGQGLGSQALTLLRAWRPAQRLVLEVEVLNPQAANYSQRVRRVHFYERNGYRMTDINYSTYGVPFTVMLNGTNIDAASYHQFYDPIVTK